MIPIIPFVPLVKQVTLQEIALACEENPIAPRPKDKIAVAPNPTNGFATVMYELLQAGTVELLVTDASGKELISKQNPAQVGSFTIDLSRYPTGYYPVQLLQNGVIIYNTQLIKK